VETSKDRPGGPSDLGRLRKYDVGHRVVVDRSEILVPLEGEVRVCCGEGQSL
jgi:hypothetical protein